MVPGTSPMVRSGFSIFLSNMTSGGIAYPPALQQDKTVIWVLSLLEREDGCFSPFLDTTFGGFGLSGKPDSSKLKIWQGRSQISHSSSVLSSSSK